jgi:hypothetical protein
VAVINASRANLTEVVAGIGRPGGIAYRAGATWVTDTADDLRLTNSGYGPATAIPRPLRKHADAQLWTSSAPIS